VAVGWSPYVYGRWAWISPYGWTWVSYEPWGWYPYRCGYWVPDPVYGWFWSPYNAFVSVNFVFGSHRYRHHNVYFRPATVRFVPEGRNVRWVPLRPGERYRSSGFVRGDARLERWNRPLATGRVFVRGGTDRREWRDYSVVRAERQVEIRKTRAAAQSRTDTRTVRPERRAVRPPAGQPASRSAPRGDRGTFTPRRAVPKAGNVERQAPPRSVPAARPAERDQVREVAPKAPPGPGKVKRQAPPPRSVPAARPAERDQVREVAPKEDRSGGPPAGRSPDPGSRGQESRGDRGGDDGGRGNDRGGDRGGGGRGR